MDELQDRPAVLALSRLADYGFVLAGGTRSRLMASSIDRARTSTSSPTDGTLRTSPEPSTR
jgi:hypothetical protein